MKEKMHIYYDNESDYLEIRFGEPTQSIYEKISPDVFVRIDKKTGKKKGYALFNIKKATQMPKSIDVEIPSVALAV